MNKKERIEVVVTHVFSGKQWHNMVELFTGEVRDMAREILTKVESVSAAYDAKLTAAAASISQDVDELKRQIAELSANGDTAGVLEALDAFGTKIEGTLVFDPVPEFPGAPTEPVL